LGGWSDWKNSGGNSCFFDRKKEGGLCSRKATQKKRANMAGAKKGREKKGGSTNSQSAGTLAQRVGGWGKVTAIEKKHNGYKNLVGLHAGEKKKPLRAERKKWGVGKRGNRKLQCPTQKENEKINQWYDGEISIGPSRGGGSKEGERSPIKGEKKGFLNEKKKKTQENIPSHASYWGKRRESTGDPDQTGKVKKVKLGGGGGATSGGTRSAGGTRTLICNWIFGGGVGPQHKCGGGKVGGMWKGKRRVRRGKPKKTPPQGKRRKDSSGTSQGGGSLRFRKKRP